MLNISTPLCQLFSIWHRAMMCMSFCPLFRSHTTDLGACMPFLSIDPWIVNVNLLGLRLREVFGFVPCCRNKSLIVRSKGLQRLLPLMQNSDVKVQAAATSLLLSLSALDSNKEEIGLSGFIPALINLMQKDHTRRDALRALYNLSISPCNVEHIVKGGGVPFLLDAVSNASLTSKSLATLSNLAGTVVGRDAFGELKDVAYAVLVDAVRWVENAKCQERAVYILMMIAHHNPLQHDAMIAAGAIPVLLELSLLGSALARKRAARTLDSFRRSKVCSAPQQRQSEEFEILCSNGSQSMPRASSEKKVVDGLVKQSLYRTMQRITRRANLSMVMGDAMTSSVRSTTGSFRQVSIDRRSSSCSIPL
ncbi:hypothetical protein KP509_14G074600 [Ceratopteris richardii]|uniref:U-box domain-containing protein n=1 Tax=Ceratopteris richardii TaxID=49495 RepID=A0A8T2TBA0_CERRI|nr:hypothetical protein KP509_14G074600 [Ceratopteris richardii]